MTITDVGGLQIKYIDISKAFFNGASKTFLILAIVSFVASVLFGKIVLPLLTKTYISANEQMANLAAIQTSEIVKEKKNKGEWF